MLWPYEWLCVRWFNYCTHTRTNRTPSITHTFDCMPSWLGFWAFRNVRVKSLNHSNWWDAHKHRAHIASYQSAITMSNETVHLCIRMHDMRTVLVENCSLTFCSMNAYAMCVDIIISEQSICACLWVSWSGSPGLMNFSFSYSFFFWNRDQNLRCCIVYWHDRVCQAHSMPTRTRDESITERKRNHRQLRQRPIHLFSMCDGKSRLCGHGMTLSTNSHSTMLLLVLQIELYRSMPAIALPATHTLACYVVKVINKQQQREND